jgi:hypothetical protein
MSDRHYYITGADLLEALAPLVGEEPDNLRRIVLDIPFDSVVVIHVEKLGDSRMLKIDWAGALEDTRFRIVDVQSGFEPRLGGNSEDENEPEHQRTGPVAQ